MGRPTVDPEGFYRTIEHTADIGIEVEAPDKPGVFIRSALAMFDLMFGLESIEGTDTKHIAATASNLDELLVAWLNEVLYVYAVERFVFSAFTNARLSPGSFSASAVGERLNPDRHKGSLEIKAATYHNLSFKYDDGKWKVQIIFDV